ncbi:universal stress protein YxiE [Lentibacillus kapialis]|uniref:Universal stress protein YxiE n=1 Tax=Lentibacillus kapialis TaxID=340214 RepID=A0A917PT29_9BACI|nr:universal stress protein [Lentibacillus kapialis]GGJ91242.1 universal stress protein YxiE [Lentibacillus kapialis]
MLCSKILVAYDGSDLSERSLEKAIEIAQMNAAIEMDILYTVDIPRTPYIVEDAFNSMQASMHQHGDDILAEAKAKLSSIENTFRFFKTEGQASQVILEHAEQHGCDLIVMGSRGLSGVKELLGSVSHHVVQYSSIPVFIVK